MTRIAGQQARDLLEGATSGPWGVETYRSDEMFGEPAEFVTDVGPIGALWLNTSPDACLTGSHMDHRLAAAAPDLAETIAWLYGREADRVGGWTDLRYELGDGFRVDLRGDRVSVGTGRLSMHFSRDEAVDLARALLAAAQEARNGQ